MRLVMKDTLHGNLSTAEKKGRKPLEDHRRLREGSTHTSVTANSLYSLSLFPCSFLNERLIDNLRPLFLPPPTPQTPHRPHGGRLTSPCDLCVTHSQRSSPNCRTSAGFRLSYQQHNVQVMVRSEHPIQRPVRHIFATTQYAPGPFWPLQSCAFTFHVFGD